MLRKCGIHLRLKTTYLLKQYFFNKFKTKISQKITNGFKISLHFEENPLQNWGKYYWSILANKICQGFTTGKDCTKLEENMSNIVTLQRCRFMFVLATTGNVFQGSGSVLVSWSRLQASPRGTSEQFSFPTEIR